MAQIILDHVEKAYPGGVKAVDDLGLEIADGEFMVLVGPSGCGKSTALRSIAGLEEISAGTITIGDRYLDLDLGPQFDFGHGGGYTTFRHANARLSAGRLPLAALENGEQVEVSVDVSNTGGRDGDEVVQLYVRDMVSSVAQPVRRLVAFARRHVGAGQTITVSFTLGREQLGFWDVEANPARFVVEAGTFALYIGASLYATRELTFEVL